MFECSQVTPVVCPTGYQPGLWRMDGRAEVHAVASAPIAEVPWSKRNAWGGEALVFVTPNVRDKRPDAVDGRACVVQHNRAHHAGPDGRRSGSA